MRFIRSHTGELFNLDYVQEIGRTIEKENDKTYYLIYLILSHRQGMETIQQFDCAFKCTKYLNKLEELIALKIEE
jgi:hypothetical protein